MYGKQLGLTIYIPSTTEASITPITSMFEEELATAFVGLIFTESLCSLE
jgi:hypothetical protein